LRCGSNQQETAAVAAVCSPKSSCLSVSPIETANGEIFINIKAPFDSHVRAYRIYVFTSEIMKRFLLNHL
jgi:hypothetical protein